MGETRTVNRLNYRSTHSTVGVKERDAAVNAHFLHDNDHLIDTLLYCLVIIFGCTAGYPRGYNGRNVCYITWGITTCMWDSDKTQSPQRLTQG